MQPRIITEISRRKAKDEYAVYIDGEYAFEVDAEALFRFGLKAGEPIDAATEQAARRQSEQSRAKSAALRFLSARPRTAAEVQGRLAKAGFAAEVVEDVVSWLQGLGYLDDEAFARGWVESRVRLKPMGALRLAQELRQKGVCRETVAQTLAGVTREQEVEWAFAVAAERLRRMKNVPKEVARRRLYGLLERRGFRPDVIREVVFNALP